MKIRAYLFKSKEFIYPEDNTPGAISTFFGVLQGYTNKGLKYDINYSSGIKDDEQTEVYEEDLIEVIFKYTGGKVEKVSGVVEFVLGCFNVNNEQGLDLDLANCEGNLKIIGNSYESGKRTV